MINIKDGNFFRVQKGARVVHEKIYITQVIHFFLQQMQPSYYQHELTKKHLFAIDLIDLKCNQNIFRTVLN